MRWIGNRRFPSRARTSFFRFRARDQGKPLLSVIKKKPAGLATGRLKKRPCLVLTELALAADQERQASQTNEEAAGRLRDQHCSSQRRVVSCRRKTAGVEGGIKGPEQNLGILVDDRGRQGRLRIAEGPYLENRSFRGITEGAPVSENKVDGTA